MEDNVSKPDQSLYRTQDAAANFQDEVKKVMANAGFRQSKYSPCAYYHPVRRLRTLVHGDDFVTSGRRFHVQWLRHVLEDRFEIKTKVIGQAVADKREARVLNRVIRVTEQGWNMSQTSDMHS